MTRAAVTVEPDASSLHKHCKLFGPPKCLPTTQTNPPPELSTKSGVAYWQAGWSSWGATTLGYSVCFPLSSFRVATSNDAGETVSSTNPSVPSTATRTVAGARLGAKHSTPAALSEVTRPFTAICPKRQTGCVVGNAPKDPVNVSSPPNSEGTDFGKPLTTTAPLPVRYTFSVEGGSLSIVPETLNPKLNPKPVSLSAAA
mmetsp:Transcript_145/g.497  ORF Transcript_145/g.497 Transcript_145/m.497 type:complete len:200 (-) Transcript_145:1921-2520(-)